MISTHAASLGQVLSFPILLKSCVLRRPTLAFYFRMDGPKQTSKADTSFPHHVRTYPEQMNNHHQDMDGTCHEYLPRHGKKKGTATGRPMLKALPSSVMINLPFFLQHTQHGSHL